MLFTRQALFRFAIALAMVVGLLRPPFDVDLHAVTGTMSYDKVVQHSGDHFQLAHGFSSDNDDSSADQHNAADHSHVPSSMPPSLMIFRSSSGWARPAPLEPAPMRSANISLDRPPRPTV